MLGAVGCSSVYWALYCALPVVAALLVARSGGRAYVEQDGPRLVRALRWIAMAYGYLWLLTDRLPELDGDASVDVDVTTGAAPTIGGALLRLVTSLPALVIFTLLSVMAGILWVVGAISVLAVERVPVWMSDLFAATLRYQLRLLAYHLSLVDAYPSLSDVAMRLPPSTYPGAA